MKNKYVNKMVTKAKTRLCLFCLDSGHLVKKKKPEKDTRPNFLKIILMRFAWCNILAR